MVQHLMQRRLLRRFICSCILIFPHVQGWTLLSPRFYEPSNSILLNARYFSPATNSRHVALMTKSSSNGDKESNNKMEDDKDRQHYPSTDLGSSESQFMRKVNGTQTNSDDAAGDSASTSSTSREKSKQMKQQQIEAKMEAKQQQIEAVVRKKIRVARAQAEIDRILTGPDAPCDIDREWSKVVSVSPSAMDGTASTSAKQGAEEDIENDDASENPRTGSSSEKLVANNSFDSDQLQQQQTQHELKCQELEQDLYEAVKFNDLDTASVKRQALDRLQIDNANAVLQVNAAFYKAFSSKDYKAMSSLWIPDATATCIHPSYKKPLIGNRAVLQNWKSMFGSKNVNTAFQRNWIEPSNMHIATVGSSSMAIVTCYENVYVRRFIRGQKRETVQVHTLQATNIFRKVAGIWYLQHHHSSSIPGSTKSQVAPSNGDYTGSNSKRRSLIYNKNKFDEYDDNDDPADDNSNMEIGMDGILGIQNYGADLGPDGTKRQPSSQQQPKRIIVSGLSDLLSGNLEDLISDATKDLNGGNKNSDDQGYALIRVSRMEEDEEDDDDDIEDEDDEDEDDEDDEDDEVEDLQVELESALDHEKRKNEASVSIIKQWADAESEIMERNKMKKVQDEELVAKELTMQQQESKDNIMRQECIVTLRKLAQQGLLTPSHKRVLLTDIITCSNNSQNASGNEQVTTTSNKSMVQRAYELLLGSSYNAGTGASPAPSATTTGGEDKTNRRKKKEENDWRTIAEEEFAEQCRVFAEKLM